MCSCRWQRDRRDALTWQGTERSPCRQGATRAAQGPDPGLCLPSPQVRPHVTDFADPLPDEWVWKNVKHDGVAPAAPHGPDQMKAVVTARLRRLQRLPQIVRGFFGDPELAYITAVA